MSVHEKKGIKKVVELKTAPWPFWLILVSSILAGIGTGYLLVWQNLKRMNLKKEAKSFLLFGFGVMILMYLALLMMAKANWDTKYLGTLFLFFIPVWFEFKYFKNWRMNHAGVALRFTWAAIGWSVLGLVLSAVTGFVLVSWIG